MKDIYSVDGKYVTMLLNHVIFHKGNWKRVDVMSVNPSSSGYDDDFISIFNLRHKGSYGTGEKHTWGIWGI